MAPGSLRQRRHFGEDGDTEPLKSERQQGSPLPPFPGRPIAHEPASYEGFRSLHPPAGRR